MHIDSRINENVHQPGTATHLLQIALSKDCSCAYLDHNSYVDCSKIYPYTKESIVKEVNENHDLHLGEMTSTHWECVHNATVKAVTISNKIKKRFALI
jgi:hypothetical protein